MALTAKVDVTVTPATLTVTSDKRLIDVTVTSAGETAEGTATFPIKVTDQAHTWAADSDDGHVAVYHLAP